MKDIIVMGAGDLSKDIAWLIERINNNNPEWNLLGFTEVTDEKEFEGYPILGNDDVVNNYKDTYVVCGVANTKVREKIINNLSNDIKIATLIDPSAIIHRTAIIEEGSIVFANTLVGINAHVGKHNVLLYGVNVNHDVKVGNFVTMYPNATISGKCIIGNNCELGTGSSIIQGKTICDNCSKP